MQTSARTSILRVLHTHKQASMAELLAHTNYCKSSCEQVLSDLVAKRLVQRSPHCKPRVFWLTAKGIALAHNLFKPTPLKVDHASL